MYEASVLIPLSAISAFSIKTQAELRGYILDQVGMPTSQTADGGSAEEGAKLSVAEAKTFLNNCSEKTTFILSQIVDRDGDFMMSDIARVLHCSSSELRGAWAGITKRVRTITGDPQAKLISWFKRGKDWHGVVPAETIESMRIALAANR